MSTEPYRTSTCDILLSCHVQKSTERSGPSTLHHSINFVRLPFDHPEACSPADACATIPPSRGCPGVIYSESQNPAVTSLCPLLGLDLALGRVVSTPRSMSSLQRDLLGELEVHSGRAQVTTRTQGHQPLSRPTGNNKVCRTTGPPSGSEIYRLCGLQVGHPR